MEKQSVVLLLYDKNNVDNLLLFNKGSKWELPILDATDFHKDNSVIINSIKKKIGDIPLMMSVDPISSINLNGEVRSSSIFAGIISSDNINLGKQISKMVDWRWAYRTLKNENMRQAIIHGNNWISSSKTSIEFLSTNLEIARSIDR